MLVAWAFFCGLNAATPADYEREAIARATVGGGSTPMACLLDGQAGAAANSALARRMWSTS